jgi:predicted dehydrogenase
MILAVLGCGSIGRRLIRNLLSKGYNDLVLFDVNTNIREEVMKEFGLQCAETIEDVWQSKPSVVFVMTPAPTHLELAKAALNHGLDLFVEKPLSNSLDGVADVVKQLAEKGSVSMVGCNMRFHPGPAKIRELIHSGKLGRIISARIEVGSYLPGWRPWQNYRDSISANAQDGGGAALECIHEIDLALWLFGPAQVAGAAGAIASTLEIDVEGLVEILLRHDSGVISSIHLNFVQRDYDRSCKVIGSEGTAYWNFTKSFVEVRADSETITRYDLPADWKVNDMYSDQLDYFMNCIDERTQTFHPISGSIGELEIALRARTAAWRE